jgi:hypothetical protein
MNFKQWMNLVDLELQSICGLGTNDLADYMYYDLFDAECTPHEVALEVLEDNGYPMDLLEAT